MRKNPKDSNVGDNKRLRAEVRENKKTSDRTLRQMWKEFDELRGAVITLLNYTGHTGWAARLGKRVSLPKPR